MQPMFQYQTYAVVWFDVFSSIHCLLHHFLLVVFVFLYFYSGKQSMGHVEKFLIRNYTKLEKFTEYKFYQSLYF